MRERDRERQRQIVSQAANHTDRHIDRQTDRNREEKRLEHTYQMYPHTHTCTPHTHTHTHTHTHREGNYIRPPILSTVTSVHFLQGTQTAIRQYNKITGGSHCRTSIIAHHASSYTSALLPVVNTHRRVQNGFVGWTLFNAALSHMWSEQDMVR